MKSLATCALFLAVLSPVLQTADACGSTPPPPHQGFCFRNEKVDGAQSHPCWSDKVHGACDKYCKDHAFKIGACMEEDKCCCFGG
ncbi:hypothetical protein AAVH_14566 [Aphelenchoides avenae]|nr:hypothetical protein AAVH_14566 [Aphelenchus avenae]